MILDIILESDSDYHSSSYIDFYDPFLYYSFGSWDYYRPGYYDFTARVYTSSPAVVASMAMENVLMARQFNSMDSALKSSTLLTSTTIQGGDDIGGIVSFNKINKAPDYKIVFTNSSTKKSSEILFARSDREEILNPWLDKQRTIFTLMGKHTFGLGRYTLEMDLLSSKLFGLNTGFSYYRGTKAMGINIGFNLKSAEYTWVYCNGELVLEDDSISVLPQFGIQFAVNNLTFSGGAAYNILKEKWYAEGALGFAF